METLETYRHQSGLTDELLCLLRKAGCVTVMDFLDRDLEHHLAKESPVDPKIIRQLRQFFLRQFAPPSATAAELYRINHVGKDSINFGVSAVDQLFCGEFRCGQILELCGPPLSGKTQLLLKLVANTLQNNVSSRILYIDTCGQFGSERLFRILTDAGCAAEKAAEMMKRVDVATVSSCERLLQLLDTGATWCAQNAVPLRSAVPLGSAVPPRSSVPSRSAVPPGSSVPPGSALLVIDFLHSLLSPLVGGQSFAGYDLLNAVGQALGYFSSSLGTTVVYTNSASSGDGDRYTAALGVYWSSVPHHRLLLTSRLTPTEPTEPTEPNEPNEPTEPIEPVKLTEPTSGSFPIKITLLKSTSLPCQKNSAEFRIEADGKILS